MNMFEELRSYNEVWDNRRLFTVCIEFMYWYEINENLAASGQGLPEIEKSYWAMIEPLRGRIDYFSKDESVKRSKPKRDTLDLFPHSLRHYTHNTLNGINQITLLQGAEKDKSDVFFDAHLTEFSYQRMGLSMEEVLADPQRFVQQCVASMVGVKFKSGIGGFSYNYEDVYINSNPHLQDPIIGRYRGVNVINPWRYRKMDGVPTVNWLTLVSDADIARLGGWETLAAQVQAPLVLHRLAHGALLQAGPQPLVGAVNQQERLAAYHAVGKILEPVKSSRLVSSWVGGGDVEATEWMHRFFRPCPF